MSGKAEDAGAENMQSENMRQDDMRAENVGLESGAAAKRAGGVSVAGVNAACGGSNAKPAAENARAESDISAKKAAAKKAAAKNAAAESNAGAGEDAESAAGPAAEPDSVSGVSGRSPRLRVHGFTQPWQEKKFSDLAVIRRGLTYKPGNVVSEGIRVLRSSNINEDVFELHDDDVFVEDESVNIPYVENGDILITSANGSNRLVGKHALICGIEENSAVHGGFMLAASSAVPDFVNALMGSSWYSKFISTYVAGGNGAIGNLKKSDLDEQPVFVPSDIEEQRLVGRFFSSLDRIISVQERKTEALRQAKKYFLQNMFPRRGESAPRLRVHGFMQPWQTRKFGDTVTIERGGSPRPIDKFITDDENGLNWIKIGDAPEFGNYITHTAEKIIPEGLSKTRQVHPGDLILSNSMSFGKPYIMGINGCIHDGWLLIRDEEENYDLKFLCVLLGTESMLNQYKAMAAGSTVNNLNKQLVGGTVVSYPSLEEQRLIGRFFSGLDRIIGVQERKTEALRQAKKYYLQNMFA